MHRNNNHHKNSSANVQLSEEATLFAAYLEETIQNLDPASARFWKDLDQLLPSSGKAVLKADVSHDLGTRFGWKNIEQRSMNFKALENKFLTGYAIPAGIGHGVQCRELGVIYRLLPGRLFPPDESLTIMSKDPLEAVEEMRIKWKGNKYVKNDSLSHLQTRFLSDLLEVVVPSTAHEVGKGVAAHGGTFLDDVMKFMKERKGWNLPNCRQFLSELSIFGVVRQIVVNPALDPFMGTMVFVVKEKIPNNLVPNENSNGNNHLDRKNFNGEHSSNNKEISSKYNNNSSNNGDTHIPESSVGAGFIPVSLSNWINNEIVDLVHRSKKVQQDELTFKEKALLASLVSTLLRLPQFYLGGCAAKMSKHLANRKSVLLSSTPLYLEKTTGSERGTSPQVVDKEIKEMYETYDFLVTKQYLFETLPPRAHPDNTSVKLHGDLCASINHKKIDEILDQLRDFQTTKHNNKSEDYARRRETMAPSSQATTIERNNNNNYQNTNDDRDDVVVASPLPRLGGIRRSRSPVGNQNIHNNHNNNNNLISTYPQSNQFIVSNDDGNFQQRQQIYIPQQPTMAVGTAITTNNNSSIVVAPTFLYDAQGNPTVMIGPDGVMTVLPTAALAGPKPISIIMNNNNNNINPIVDAPPPQYSPSSSSIASTVLPLTFVAVQRHPLESILYPPPMCFFMGEHVVRPQNSRILLSPPPILLTQQKY